jgi:hypothetical protein
MDPENLQQIEDLGLGEVWDDEAGGFTPWLVRNIDRLGKAIGIEIEDVELEGSVGEYSVDIRGTEMNRDEPVVIENQFGTTDHRHLGQLLTYGAGTEAEFVIWVSERFREEHRSVLEWLNGSSASGAKFFGIRPRVVRVNGGEDIGFEFMVVVEPNNWERGIQDESLTERQQAYQQFFSKLTDAYSEEHPDWNKLKAQPQSWLSFGAGKGGVALGWAFHKGPELSTELYIDTQDAEENDRMYSQLKEDSEQIEDALGELVWQRLPEKRASRIKTAREISDYVENLSSKERRELINWAVDRMESFQNEFEPRIKEL